MALEGALVTYGVSFSCRLESCATCTSTSCDHACHVAGVVDGGNVYDDAEDLDGTDPA